MKPRDAKQLAEAVRVATTPFEVVGLGTKPTLGNAVKATKLDLSAFNGAINYEPEELIFECGAATKLSVVEKLLAQKNQMLAFEPPDFSSLLGSAHAGSMGGALACNLAGPRRLKAGAARDHILGVTGVNGQGEIIRSGARVVKNVTGYDVPRLLAGSFGTLMAFTSVIFKVLPQPETEQTCVMADHGSAQAVNDMAEILATGAEVSSAAYVPGEGTYLRIEGIEASVKARVEIVRAAQVPRNLLAEKQSKQLWRSLRDVTSLAGHHGKEVWRVVLPPSEAVNFLARLPFSHRYYLDWAGSLIWLETEQGNDIRKFLTQGIATRFVGHSALDVFHPLPKELNALSARVKAAFDPKGLLNPGKMSRDF